MRRWCLGVAFLLTGCYRPATEAPCVVTCNFNGERACPGDQQCMADNLCHAPGGGCGDTGDANDRIDAEDPTDGPPLDDPPGAFCFGRTSGSGLIRVCTQTAPMSGVTLPPTLNTDSHQLCETHAQGPNLPSACVIYGTQISLPSGTMSRIEGSRPLVLVSTTGIAIDGFLDVASHIDSTTSGAGADAPECPLPIAPTQSTGGGAGGAAGGTGQGAGGIGGTSGGGNQGNPGTPITPTGVRGGCTGGLGLSNGTPCKPGRGGGAVYMIAPQGVSIGTSGTINASGGAARGGTGSGCGAGSGGMIGFDTPVVMRAGRLFANGGGGSSGANGPGAVDGNDSSIPSVGGFGGFNSTGGSGGNGAAGTTYVGGQGGFANTTQFAGGGGGGAGWIAVYGGATITYEGSFVSPPPNSP